MAVRPTTSRKSAEKVWAAKWQQIEALSQILKGLKHLALDCGDPYGKRISWRLRRVSCA